MTRVAILLVALSIVQACSNQKEIESGYLLHADGTYSEIFNSQELFGESGENPAILTFDSSELDVERSYLRYRVIFGTEYYTVHSLPDPEFTVAPGVYTIGLQAIDIRHYVAENRIHYGVPVSVEFELTARERTVVQLSVDDQSEFIPYTPPADAVGDDEEDVGEFIKVPLRISLPASSGSGGN